MTVYTYTVFLFNWENIGLMEQQNPDRLKKDRELIYAIVTAKGIISRFFWSILSFLITNLIFFFAAFVALLIYLLASVDNQFAFVFIAAIIFIIFYNIFFLSYLLFIYFKGQKAIENNCKYLLTILDIKSDKLLPFSLLGSLRKGYMLDEMLLEQ
ncbi:MPN163 family protein [Mycoplasmoides genitalium]|uniref:MPN163 family protein n=1 Tax=Mycoplasmoides genitalium TaxID=2097 RepID=UPI00027B3BCF|nr:hypothetical protein [Mycoplasmoides genitalium]AFQ02973.1 hypothetical protein CM9_00855 [Mycoplasmoides genitalium M2321]